MMYADQRWIGHHGIGRFATHVLEGLKYRPISLVSNPAAPLDAWRLRRALSGASSSDLFFSPGYNTPLFCPAKLVFTIHDLSHVYCPENSSPLIRLYYATFLKQACRRAARILTVSEFTRAQVTEWSGVAPSAICNVSCGVDGNYRPDGETYGLRFPYLLSVTNRKLHKNEFRMLDAFARADLDPEVHLVLTGERTSALASHIQKRNLMRRVHFLGVVPEERLPSLYRGAVGLIFTSLYEGFGLPLLEAMACGTPVLTSNVTAMPEIAGDAALLVDPTSTPQIAESIQRLVGDPCLRTRLREKGLQRASQFPWAATRDKVHRVLDEIQASR